MSGSSHLPLHSTATAPSGSSTRALLSCWTSSKRTGPPTILGWFAAPTTLPPSDTATSFAAPATLISPTCSKLRISLPIMRMDATTLSAALLHDVIEDTEFPVSRIQERFGEEDRPVGRRRH
jgi:hypothetical protein